MTGRVFLGLALCNAIWALNPTMGKILLRDFAAMEVAWLRYTFACVTSLVMVLALLQLKPRAISPVSSLFQKSHAPWILAMGLITFFWSPFAQYRGLSLSSSTANALIVATEPLIAMLLAWIFLGERLGLKQLAAVLLSLCGFFLLSNIKPGQLTTSFAAFSWGNVFLLSSMPAEAMYTIISRKLSGKITAVSIFSSALACGVLAITFLLFYQGYSIPELGRLSTESWMALFWMGPVGTAATYIFWTMALEDAPVAAVSLTLFIQPILGAIVGTIWLGEVLDSWQKIGGILIVVALAIQVLTMRKARAHENKTANDR